MQGREEALELARIANSLIEQATPRLWGGFADQQMRVRVTRGFDPEANQEHTLMLVCNSAADALLERHTGKFPPEQLILTGLAKGFALQTTMLALVRGLPKDPVDLEHTAAHVQNDGRGYTVCWIAVHGRGQDMVGLNPPLMEQEHVEGIARLLARTA